MKTISSSLKVIYWSFALIAPMHSPEADVSHFSSVIQTSCLSPRIISDISAVKDVFNLPPALQSLDNATGTANQSRHADKNRIHFDIAKKEKAIKQRGAILQLLHENDYRQFYIDDLVEYCFNQSPSSVFVLMYKGEQLIGIAIFCEYKIYPDEIPDTVLFVASAIKKELWRQGFGKQLWKKRLQIIKEMGYESFHIETGNETFKRWIEQLEQDGIITVRQGVVAPCSACNLWFRGTFTATPPNIVSPLHIFSGEENIMEQAI